MKSFTSRTTFEHTVPVQEETAPAATGVGFKDVLSPILNILMFGNTALILPTDKVSLLAI